MDDSIGPEDNPAKPPEKPPEQSNLVPEVPPPIAHKTERTYSNPDPTPLWKIILESGAVAVGITVAIIYYCQLKTMQHQLEMADRPWIKDTVRSNGDFMASNGAFSWTVIIRAENVGHSVATAIFPETKLIAVHGADFVDGPRQQAKELCNTVSNRFERVKNDPAVWGIAIFPGDYADLPWSPILWQFQINGATFDNGPNGKSVIPMLIGCIEYHYATSPNPHKTWFVYTLTHSDDPALPLPSRVFFSVGKTVPNTNMVLIKAGQFAD